MKCFSKYVNKCNIVTKVLILTKDNFNDSLHHIRVTKICMEKDVCPDLTGLLLKNTLGPNYLPCKI